jgi:hypothetical protein
MIVRGRLTIVWGPLIAPEGIDDDRFFLDWRHKGSAIESDANIGRRDLEGIKEGTSTMKSNVSAFDHLQMHLPLCVIHAK